ncbi:hypothetical protein Vi05172_g7970 [Venturia inaequalis]|uniref:Uncharacterized protein n=1 Tax=Venturia inaequalis TaxID=5025 RepID=A0A8H3YWG5_VENIN|nr:hypothetical protein EG327_007998 [Venturia inaequalis]RDI82081.1 hypothetical protein Vi05172_g7970 [Venturia inaequalis]
MSSGYDRYTCCYYQQPGQHGFVEVNGNACTTCLSQGKGHQGTSMSLQDKHKTKRGRFEMASTPLNWAKDQSWETAGLKFKEEPFIGEREVAYSPRRSDHRARRL